jgi:hypothetical protein
VTPDAGNPVFNALQGRTTFFLVAWFIAGMAFHVFHMLDSIFISFFVLHMGFCLGKSVQDDLKDIKDKSMAPQPQPQPAPIPPS